MIFLRRNSDFLRPVTKNSRHENRKPLSQATFPEKSLSDSPISSPKATLKVTSISMLDVVCLLIRNVYVNNVVNAQIHPTVAGFFNLNRERIILRYCHL